MLGMDHTSSFVVFHTDKHYSAFGQQNQPLFSKISPQFFRVHSTPAATSQTRTLTPHPTLFLVKPDFLHKENVVVKNTDREKVGSPSNNV